MNIEQLLGELEGLAHKVHVPGFQDLIQTVRNIYEKTIEYITPHEPISDASRTLIALHSELNSLCTQLETSLPEFQTVYTGAGSDTYHASASFALQGMQQQRDALAHAAQQHQTMATQSALARDMQIALIVMLGAVAITLIALVASAGLDAPITVPLAIGETAGAAATIAILTEALVAAGIAVDALLAFLVTEEGLALLAATAIVITGLTHPQLLPHPITGTPGPIYHPMAGSGNQADTGIMNDAQNLIDTGKATDICDALAQLMDAATRAGDSKKKLKIKATQKAKGCRHSRHSKGL